MASKLDVWKQALVHLEKDTNITLSSTVEARYVFDAAWAGVVAQAFNEGDWNFAKKSVALVINGSETAATGWTYVFSYPADYERTIAVSPVPDFRQEFFDYIDQGGFIHTNTNVLYLRYISDARQADDQVSTWPTMFWRYVAVKLAHESCGKLTSGSTLGDKLEKMEKKALRQAKSVDARNQPNAQVPTGSWLRSRKGYGGGSGLGGTVVGGEITFGEGDV